MLGLEEKGFDYFIQITDARVDTGGLSGATPAEAVSWGKVDPDQLPDSVVCYVDSTIAVPLMTAYAIGKHPPRKLKRLYDTRDRALEAHRRRDPRKVRQRAAGAALRKTAPRRRPPACPPLLPPRPSSRS